MNPQTLYAHCKASEGLSTHEQRNLMLIAINAHFYDSASDVARQDKTGTLVRELKQKLESIVYEESLTMIGDEPCSPAEKALAWLER